MLDLRDWRPEDGCMSQASTDHIAVADAAAELGVSPGSIRRWYDKGALDGFETPGGQRRIWRRSVEALRNEWRGTPAEAQS